MSNPGIAPPDLNTDLGRVRSIIGDVTYVPLVPPVSGQGDYENFSDAQLSSFLGLSPGNIAHAAGYAYLGLAAQFAADSIRVTTDDQSIDLTARAESMRKLAAEWFARGDAAAESENDRFFSIVYPVFEDDFSNPAELEPPNVWW